MIRKRGTAASRRARQPEAASRPAPTVAADSHYSVVATTKPARVVYGREPSQREIRDRAYYIYLARGGANGNPRSDWLRAEHELRAELGSGAAPGRRF